jgi:uncharacterized membrane protein YkoI
MVKLRQGGGKERLPFCGAWDGTGPPKWKDETMLNRKKIFTSALLLTLGTALAGGAIAASAGSNSAGTKTETNELQAIQNAKLTIADAAKAAETETGGKAVDVSIEDENGQVAYQVEVALNDGTMKEVQVDTQSGQILKVSADEQDQDGGKDEGGEDGENGED